jgi:bifunctional DNA-binding transcriptional regulator/antitoxin component of YhaV-PrlF toxin-antitoxin module
MIIIPWPIRNFFGLLNGTIRETEKIGSTIFVSPFKDRPSLRIGVRSSRQVPVSVKLPLV